MELNLNMNLSLDENGKKKSNRVKEAEQKKALKGYQPTMDEIWFTGYESHTGKRKDGIFQSKVSAPDKARLDTVYQAIQSGELGVGVEDLKKFTKAHALRLHKVYMESQREATIKDMIANRPENYKLVTELDELLKLCKKLKRERVIGLDTETNGLNIFGAGGEDPTKIVGFVISLKSYNEHYYIPFGHLTGEKQLPEHVVMEALKPFIESDQLLKVFHNAKYDIHVMKNHNLNLKGFHFDTMIAMSLLNENEPSYALKNLANKYGQYFGYEDSSSTYEELFGKTGFENTPLDVGSIYAAKDGHLTLMFYDFIMEQFERMPELKEYYFDIEKDITLVSVEMERNGFTVDLDYATKYAKELEHDVSMLEVELKRHFGDINVNSPAQLSEVLFDKLGLHKHFPKNWKRSTDKNVLKKLSEHHKGCEILLQYRDINKLLNTYVIPLPEKTDRHGKLHGQFNQSGTVTGRFSSNNPNLQNLPYKARKLIKASEGMVIVGCDFSQIEPRVLAHMSNDEAFKTPYVVGRDLYSEIASQTFKKPIEECLDGSIYRKYAKVILLGVMYGMSPNALAGMLGIPTYEAEQFINDFFATYEGVTNFVKAQNDLADVNGFVRTMFNRKRRFIGHQQVAKAYKAFIKKLEGKYGDVPKDIWGSDMDYNDKMNLWKVAKPYGRVNRMSVNAVIQGSAAEIMKIAMIKLYKHCLEKGYKFIATVHDEVLIEVPETISIEEVEVLENIMADAVQISIPIKCDVEISRVWGEGVSKKEWFKGATA
ncbi:DNA polymerase [Priestia megaterium]